MHVWKCPECKYLIRTLCEQLQETLEVTGAQVFDPYNVVLLRAYSQLDCRVLVHSADIAHLHHIPNLLRLKRDLRVSFLVYDSLENVKSERLKTIFPRGGLVIMDKGMLIGCPSGMQIHISCNTQLFSPLGKSCRKGYIFLFLYVFTT